MSKAKARTLKGLAPVDLVILAERWHEFGDDRVDVPTAPSGYLKYASPEQVQALASRLPHCRIYLPMDTDKMPHGGVPAFLGNRNIFHLNLSTRPNLPPTPPASFVRTVVAFPLKALSLTIADAVDDVTKYLVALSHPPGYYRVADGCPVDGCLLPAGRYRAGPSPCVPHFEASHVDHSRCVLCYSGVAARVWSRRQRGRAGLVTIGQGTVKPADVHCVGCDRGLCMLHARTFANHCNGCNRRCNRCNRFVAECVCNLRSLALDAWNPTQAGRTFFICPTCGQPGNECSCLGREMRRLSEDFNANP